ncbi:hypothetical protein [Kitasatospora viridis]|uniref:Uncharacterized protein n=1 Tax=Kitasatospora viridis TaxID=281105 RepID=A0A561TWI4_9ACTN|nr:hypothetical protein [Kitasatospora viridis]TWF91459.1 hypothetical protein FHX73_12574 [Kitasatospora viridis]
MPQPTIDPSSVHRQRCTGESHQALRQAGQDGCAIPAAGHPDQAALEAAIFQKACTMGGLSSHPLGIVKVRPESGRLTIRLLDEPYVVRHWVERLLPRQAAVAGEDDDPRDCVIGVAGLRGRVGAGGVTLAWPGTGANVLLTGFNTRWWKRITDLLASCGSQPFTGVGWAPVERAAHRAWQTTSAEAPALSAILRRVRATAGPGEINSTDAWATGLEGLRLETTDGPSCSEFVELLCEWPSVLGWRADGVWCTCRSATPQGCRIDFQLPDGRRVDYSNLHWGRTNDEQRQSAVTRLNASAFAA